MKRLAITRIAPSASAERCSAFPCPYWWPDVGRPRRDADREERQERGDEVGAGVRRLRERGRGCASRGPCRASARSGRSRRAPRRARSAAAESRRAAYSGCLAVARAARRGRPAGARNGRRVARRARAARSTRARSRLGGCSGHGSWWMSARCEPAAVVGRVEAVALDQEPLERSRLGMKDGARRAGSCPLNTRPGSSIACALVVDPLAALRAPTCARGSTAACTCGAPPRPPAGSRRRG